MKIFIKSIITIIISSIVALSLLTLVYMIPTDRIRLNIANSIEQYNNSGTNPQWSVGYTFTEFDEYTDASFILTTAVYPGAEHDKNPFRNAYLSNHVDYRNVNNDIVYELDENYNGDSFIFGYYRYWHGYLIFLKPLLYLFSLNTVRIMNFIFQLIITLTVMQLLAIKTKSLLQGLPLIVAIAMLNPVSTAINFQLAAVYNVTMLAILVMLICSDKLDADKDMPLFFLLVGITVVFFDFLTYPVVSLVLPLVLYISLPNWSDGNNKKYSSVIRVLKYSFFWAMGYGGMWLMKWIWVTLFTLGKENSIAEAIHTIIYRSGNGEVHYSFLTTVLEALKPIMIWPFVILFGLMILVTVIAVVTKKIKIDVHKDHSRLVALLLTAIIPFGWYFVAREHSYDHAVFTYRCLAGTVMAVLTIVTSMIKKRDL